jgi:hypothetical protein
MWSAGEGDNQERFLADLRALRDAAALGYDELAARAHYPSNILKEAENGPGLPGLPILAAYVRACGADVPEWEERWRRLAPEAQTDPGLPVRPAGASPAAVAGARAGITIAPPDVYDPERIRAALRGQGGSANHAVRKTGPARAAALGRAEPDTAPADPGTPDGQAAWNSRAGWADSVRDGGSREDTGSGWQTETRWDTATGWNAPADSDTAPANGNHHAAYATSVFDPPVTEAFGPQAPSPATREDAAPTSWSADSQLAPPVTAESESAWRPAETGYAMPEDTERGPGLAQDAGSAEAASSAAAVGSAAVGSATAGSATAGAATAAGAAIAGSAEVAGPAEVGGSAVPQAAAAPVRARTTTAVAAESRSDRLFPLRLFAVMVIAAIIGSVLVLLIR